MKLAWKLAILCGCGVAAVAIPLLGFLVLLTEISDVCG